MGRVLEWGDSIQQAAHKREELKVRQLWSALDLEQTGVIDVGYMFQTVPQLKFRPEESKVLRTTLLDKPAPFDLQDNGEPPPEFAQYDWEPVRIATGTVQSSRRSSVGRVMMRAWERRCVEMDQDFKRLERRAKRLTSYIENRPEATVCLVSHAAILGLVTGDNKEGPMQNCEARVYRLRRGRWTRLQTIPAPTMADTMRAAMAAVVDAVEPEPPQAQHPEPGKV